MWRVKDNFTDFLIMQLSNLREREFNDPVKKISEVCILSSPLQSSAEINLNQHTHIKMLISGLGANSLKNNNCSSAINTMAHLFRAA